jgi:hypothetical protein
VLFCAPVTCLELVLWRYFPQTSAMVLNLYWIFSDATIVSIEIDELMRALLDLVCSFLFHRFQIVSRSSS